MLRVTKKSLQQEIEQFNDEQLNQLAEFIAFIKFRHRFTNSTKDISQFADLYQEFDQEDRELAELGILEYSQLLTIEDQA